MKYGYTIIYVEDVSRTLNFYQKAFRFETRFIHESNQYGELETGETILAFASHSLGEVNLPSGYVKSSLSSKPHGHEIAFITEDVEAAFTHAKEAGAQELSKPMKKPWGQTVAYVRSIEGTVIELCSPIG
ncbi:MAG: VOC family protein [Proteobacteria bacterium]|nr:VOC family protein [Pseudomonadota bacterium]